MSSTVTYRSGSLPSISGTITMTARMLRMLGAINERFTHLIIGPKLDFDMIRLFAMLPLFAGRHLTDLTLNLFHITHPLPVAAPLLWDLSFPPLPTVQKLDFNLSCHAKSEHLPDSARAENVRNGIRVYTHLLANSAALPALRSVGFHIFDGALAPRVLSLDADTSTVWRDLAEALLAFPRLESVPLVLMDTDPERWPATNGTKAGVEVFLGKYTPQLATGRSTPLYSVSLGEEEVVPWIVVH
ncbi:hypothetical protein C8Q74DRAFT_1295353 [Fomes fomentarius]|nr:hypothetical protein C8Q74DRAFT_1295353 [Fomes fomentarius]